MTMPSSISQSSLEESFGMMVLSFGPQMQLDALLKMIGSGGIGMPASGAWSGEFKPMAIKFEGRATHAPSRGLPATFGSLSMLAFLILARPAGESASASMSWTTLERSRILPLLSMMPGFSLPAGPKRTSFMGGPHSRWLVDVVNMG